MLWIQRGAAVGCERPRRSQPGYGPRAAHRGLFEIRQSSSALPLARVPAGSRSRVARGPQRSQVRFRPEACRRSRQQTIGGCSHCGKSKVCAGPEAHLQCANTKTRQPLVTSRRVSEHSRRKSSSRRSTAQTSPMPLEEKSRRRLPVHGYARASKRPELSSCPSRGRAGRHGRRSCRCREGRGPGVSRSITHWPRGARCSVGICDRDRARDRVSRVAARWLAIASTTQALDVAPARFTGTRGEPFEALAPLAGHVAGCGPRGGSAPTRVRRETKSAFPPVGNSWWAHVAPWSSRTVPIDRQPKSQSIAQMQGILDSGRWAIQDSNLGPLPHQESLVSPPVPPTRT